MRPTVTLYTKDYCPYCKAAKALLTEKGISFSNIEISDSPRKRQEMIQKSGGRSTVPQVFIGGHHVGGYTDLAALNAAGGLSTAIHTAKAA